MILELSYFGSPFPLNSRYFECSFFSQFTEEKECLFVGGIPLLQIVNIINVKMDNESYSKYLRALNLITSIMNGSQNNYKKVKYTEDTERLCIELLQNSMISVSSRDNTDLYPPYIENLVQNYCKNTDKITIYWQNNFGWNTKYNKLKQYL